MTTKGQITKIASRDGVDAKVVERDYVLAHIVALVSANDTAQRLIFKGGTSLRLLHVEDYRYSADLDYSVVKGTEGEAREVIRAALGQARPNAIKSLLLDGDADRISYMGPLGAEGRTIKLDLTDNELVVNTEERSLLRRWPDLPEVPIAAYTTREITAEKLRCVLQRLQCRDFLDLDLLLGGEDLAQVVDLFRRKATHKNLEPDSFAEMFERRVVEYERRWEKELGEYLGTVPDFVGVERKVRRLLRRAGLL